MTKNKIKKYEEVDAGVDQTDSASIWDSRPLRSILNEHDRLFNETDRKYGVSVLQTLVSPETAAEFARIMNRRDEAMQFGALDEIIAALDAVVRAIKTMQVEVIAKGYANGLNGKRWRTRAEDDSRWLIVQTIQDKRAAEALADFEGFQIWSLPEIICMLRSRARPRP